MEIELPCGHVLPSAIDDEIDAAPSSVGGQGTSPPRSSVPALATRGDGRSLRRRARLRGWKRPITDGPFAETKEM